MANLTPDFDEEEVDSLIPRKGMDDNYIMFIAQNRIFNAFLDGENLDKTLRLVKLLNAHLAPYRDRWPDDDGKKERGYLTRYKAIEAKWKAIDQEGKSEEEEILMGKIFELYELERMLMQKAGVLPRRMKSGLGTRHIVT